MSTINKIIDKINSIQLEKQTCTVDFPDGTNVITDDPYAAIANYISDFLEEQQGYFTDQIVVINSDTDMFPNDDHWMTTICYSDTDHMNGFLHDFYEGQKHIKLIGFTNLESVGDWIVKNVNQEFFRKD